MCKLNYFLLILFLFVLALPACFQQNNSARSYKLQGSTMGTYYHITVVATVSDFNHASAKQSIDSLLHNINKKMSTYVADSEISLFNQYKKLDWFPVSKQFLDVVKASQEISVLTSGSFDITAGNLVNLWGFGPDSQIDIPSKSQLSTTLQNTGYHLLDTRDLPPSLKKNHKDLKIDLSAIAKGYAVDEIGRLLSDMGFTNYLVEIGGEIISHGLNIKNKPWRVAIENPSLSINKRDYQKVIELNNQSVATSGDYRNYFEKSGQRYSHTIDPSTGRPITHSLASVTVKGKSAMKVDALATALMVMGDNRGKVFVKENNLDAFMIIRKSDNSLSIWNSIDTHNKN